MIRYRKYIIADLNNEGREYFEKRNCETKKLVDTKYIIIGNDWDLRNAYREVFGDTEKIERLWREWRPESNEIVRMIKALQYITFTSDRKQTKKNSILRDLLILL